MRRLATSLAARAARRALHARPPPATAPATTTAWRLLGRSPAPAPRHSQLDWARRWSTAAVADAADAGPAAPLAADAPVPTRPYSVDFTALAALTAAVRAAAVPGRLDDVVAVDRATVALRLTVAADSADGGGRAADALAPAPAPTATATLWLWLAWGVHPRLAVGPPPPPGSASAAGVAGFVDALRADLRGRVLVGAAIATDYDRVARLDWAPRVGAPVDRVLVLEAAGRAPAVALVGVADGGRRGDGAGDHDGDGASPQKKKAKKKKATTVAPPAPGVPAPPARPGRVLAVPPGSGTPYRRAVGGAGRGVFLDRGARYTWPPPPPSRLAPCLSEPADVWRANVGAAAGELDAAGRAPTVRAAIVRAYSGTSPPLAATLAAAGGLGGVDESSRVTPADLDDAGWAALHAAWARWLRAVAADEWAPGTGADGHPSPLGAGGGNDGEPGSKRALMAAAAAIDAATVDAVAAAGAAAAPGAAGELAASLARAVDDALRRVRSALAAMRAAAQSSADADALQHRADLLTSNLHLCAPGAAAVDVDDWETGARVTIELAPPRPPADVAKDLYKAAAKRRRAGNAVAPRLAEAEAREAYLAAVQCELGGGDADAGAGAGPAATAPAPPDADRLVALRNELASAGLVAAPAAASAAARGAAAAARAATAERRRYRRFTSPGGFEVLLGRNNRENDALSLQSAAPHDVWLHARGVPGAHAVLRQPASAAGDDPPPADLAFAASLAAFYSKARDATVADVSWTRARSVKKPRGAPPGAVTLLDERVTVGVPADGADAVKAAGESDGE